jgi:hypothetical protein
MSVNLSKASLKHRCRNFGIGLTALLAGLVGLFLVLRSELNVRPGVYQIPPSLALYLPASFLLILCGIVVMVRGLRPVKHELRFCLMCGVKTNQFRTDARFKDGKKIGDSCVCETCGQKYLIPTTILLPTS